MVEPLSLRIGVVDWIKGELRMKKGGIMRLGGTISLDPVTELLAELTALLSKLSK